MTSDESTSKPDADAPVPEEKDAHHAAPAEGSRMLPPSGTAAEPPLPQVVAPLPLAAGGGPSYVDTRPPSFVFLGVVSVVSLVADIATKTWAEHHLDGFPGSIQVWKNHIAFVLAKNKGGAWGLLQTAPESVRRPFFLLVSIAAIAFIVTLYRKLHPRQIALKWGLPLVLGGALGNVFDRIRYGSVIDFIDCHIQSGGHDHHWPTFNVADIAICVGVGLMGVDMLTARRSVSVPDPSPPAPPPPTPPSAPEDAPTEATGLAPETAETKT